MYNSKFLLCILQTMRKTWPRRCVRKKIFKSKFRISSQISVDLHVCIIIYSVFSNYTQLFNIYYIISYDNLYRLNLIRVIELFPDIFAIHKKKCYKTNNVSFKQSPDFLLTLTSRSTQERIHEFNNGISTYLLGKKNSYTWKIYWKLRNKKRRKISCNIFACPQY